MTLFLGKRLVESGKKEDGAGPEGLHLWVLCQHLRTPAVAAYSSLRSQSYPRDPFSSLNGLSRLRQLHPVVRAKVKPSRTSRLLHKPVNFHHFPRRDIFHIIPIFFQCLRAASQICGEFVVVLICRGETRSTSPPTSALAETLYTSSAIVDHELTDDA